MTVAAPVALQEFAQPTGLRIIASLNPKHQYGPTSQSANWNVAQWGIPQDLPGFAKSSAGYESKNPFADVRYQRDGSVELSQDGTSLPCNNEDKADSPHEFDLFIQPNSATSGYPSAEPNNIRPLAALRRVDLRFTFHVEPYQVVDTACPITQAGATAAVILTNKSKGQTLFYQLSPVLSYRYENGVRKPAVPTVRYWFFPAGPVFGFNDNVESFSKMETPIGGTAAYAIDLLPRLREVIADGAARGVDQNLSDWKLGGFYAGGLIWGHIKWSSRWSGITLREVAR